MTDYFDLLTAAKKIKGKNQFE